MCLVGEEKTRGARSDVDDFDRLACSLGIVRNLVCRIGNIVHHKRHGGNSLWRRG